jgi:SAM-dependent methyltransferase
MRPAGSGSDRLRFPAVAVPSGERVRMEIRCRRRPQGSCDSAKRRTRQSGSGSCLRRRAINATSEGEIRRSSRPRSVSYDARIRPSKRVLGDAQELPFRTASFAAVAALYFLYHLAEPELALREAHRVLQPGGLFVVATPSRDNDPEFADFVPTKPTTFDAEGAPETVASVFMEIEVERWDGPFITLPDRDAVTEYLFGRGVERPEGQEIARNVEVPLKVTKRGCLVWGRKDG